MDVVCNTVTNGCFARLANTTDKLDIFFWRNDPITCKNSMTSRNVSWNEHSKWFEKMQKSNSNYLIICSSLSGSSIGLVRFSKNRSNAKISINIAPEKRGKRLGQACLKSSEILFSKLEPKVKLLVADVKKSNIVSQNLFTKMGFELAFEHSDIYTFQKSIG